MERYGRGRAGLQQFQRERLRRLLYLTMNGHVDSGWVERQTVVTLDLAVQVLGELLEAKYKRDPMAGLDL